MITIINKENLTRKETRQAFETLEKWVASQNANPEKGLKTLHSLVYTVSTGNEQGIQGMPGSIKRMKCPIGHQL